MSTDLKLRNATAADDAALVALLHDTFESTWAPQVSEAARRRWRMEGKAAAYVEAMAAEFVVAELDGAVAGMVHWRGDFVHALHVHGRFRRRGVASALMNHAEARIAAAGEAAVRLETDGFNAASRAFYAGRGYRETGSRPDEEWDSGIVTLTLEKRLG